MADDIGCLKELPSELAYLVQPAMRYGVNQFDDDIDRFLNDVSNEQLNELATLAERVRMNDHYPAVNEWLESYRIDEYEQAANLYFLFGIMDAADLEFDSVWPPRVAGDDALGTSGWISAASTLTISRASKNLPQPPAEATE